MVRGGMGFVMVGGEGFRVRVVLVGERMEEMGGGVGGVMRVGDDGEGMEGVRVNEESVDG